MNKLFKRMSSLALVAAMIALLGASTYAVENADAPTQVEPAIEKPYDDYTMGEIQEILLAYLDETGSDLELGTPEFYEFTYEQLVEGRDVELLEHPQYSLIGDYLAHYKVISDETSVYAHSAIDDGMTEEEALETFFRFFETEEFLNTTIGQIKQAVAEQNAQCEAIMAARQAAAATNGTVSY